MEHQESNEVGQRKATVLLTTEAHRFARIERLLRHRRVATFEQMQSVLHVSPATLKRDLKAMREELGAPITWDCTERGYRLDGAWSGVAAVVYEQLGQS